MDAAMEVARATMVALRTSTCVDSKLISMKEMPTLLSKGLLTSQLRCMKATQIMRELARMERKEKRIN
jgi:hypothetical protein